MTQVPVTLTFFPLPKKVWSWPTWYGVSIAIPFAAIPPVLLSPVVFPELYAMGIENDKTGELGLVFDIVPGDIMWIGPTDIDSRVGTDGLHIIVREIEGLIPDKWKDFLPVTVPGQLAKYQDRSFQVTFKK